MALRRFQNFQIGALTAQRLNEMQDAIARLQAKMDGGSGKVDPVRDRILARVTGTPTVASAAQCVSGIPIVSYPFTEVFLRIVPSGNITDGTCVSSEVPDDAIEDRRQAYLIAFEDQPSLTVGSVVMAHLAPMSVLGNADDKQQVYVVSGGSAAASGAMRICTLTEPLDAGKYAGTLNGDAEAVEIENLYETQDYYGAGSVALECATLVTGFRLPIGSEVWAMKVSGGGNRDGAWVTMTPVPFGTDCTCGELGQPLQTMAEGRDKGTLAAGIISRIVGTA